MNFHESYICQSGNVTPYYRLMKKCISFVDILFNTHAMIIQESHFIKGDA